jgi:formate hydrogenlyase subunit 3/multisubunit Na+/H+ antiporter MnhD subunit
LNPFDILLPIGIILPLLAGTAFFFFGWLFETERAALETLALLGGLVTLAGQIAIGVGLALDISPPFATLFNWSPLPDAQVQFAFRADKLSIFFALPLAVLVALVMMYLVARQPDPEEDDEITGGRLYGLLLLAEGAGLAAFYSADLIWLYGWAELAGLCLYLLAGPGLRGASSERASFQAYATSVLGGFLLLAPLLVLVSRNGGVSLYTSITSSSFEPLIFGLVLAGVLVKASQFPFHSTLGSQRTMPAGAYLPLAAGIILPLAIYLPARLQNIAGERLDLLQEFSPALLPVGAVTVLACGWLALRDQPLNGKIGYICAAQFGFIVIALGLKLFEAVSWQLLALSLSAGLLWLSADLFQVENTPLLKKELEAPNPLVRSPRFRGLISLLYLAGALTALGLPLSPAYLSRWTTLETTLSEGYLFYFGLALAGLVAMAVALTQGLITFLRGPRQTVDGRNWSAWVVLLAPGLLGLSTVALGYYPALVNDWVKIFPAQLPVTARPAPAGFNLTNTGWYGVVGAAGLLIFIILYLSTSRRSLTPAFNGGLLYGAEEEEAQRQRASRKKTLSKFEEELPIGFDDEFFRTGTVTKTPARTSAPRFGPEPRLSPADFFATLLGSGKILFRAADTSYSGMWLSRLYQRALGFVVWLLEWITEKFYAALAALIVVVFIVLLTR